MRDQRVEVSNSGGETVLATVLCTAGSYAGMSHRARQFVAKREQGAWREVYIHEVIAKLSQFEDKPQR